MEINAKRASQLVVVWLLSVVVTQLIYIALSKAGMDINRMVIWTTEAVAFLGITVFALVALAKGERFGAAWAAIAMGGAFNVIQVGMGLAMFPPLSDAGEAMAPAFQAVLAGAFFLYFAGKFLFGFAGVVIGLDLVKSGGGLAKAAGVLAALTGVAALLVNTYAMAVGMDVVMLAGGIGTAATLFLALAIIAVNRRDAA